MRISGKLMKKNSSAVSCRTGLIVSSADRRVAANAVHGKRQTAIVSPGGICYIPKPREDAVMLIDDSEQLCLGVRMLRNDFEIEPGELVLFSGRGSRIMLRNDGRVELYGEVYVNGKLLEVE